MKSHPNKSVIGFIGLGVMGRGMVRNLVQAGYEVIVHSRTKPQAEQLLQLGVQWKESVSDLARESDAVITMVGYPHDVEQVYLGAGGLVEQARSGTLLIDMTTSCPELARTIHRKARENDLYALDAPVSGGEIGARDGTLSIMVGGDEDIFEEAMPIMGRLGKNIVRQGDAGAGQFTKMCNQIAVAVNMIAVCESLTYASQNGLDPSTVLKSIEAGAAGSWSLSMLAPKIIAEDFKPGFYVKHIIKDLQIALDSAKQLNLDLPGLQLAKTLYDQLAAMDEENSGTQALYKWYGREKQLS
jgi:3-hydroxyisobutyrate dehydrogenase